MSDLAVILLVEDRDDDILLIRKAFEKGGLLNPLQVVRTGEDALAYLSAAGKYSDSEEYPLPTLILLDLKLPGMDGFDVLQWIRSQPGINVIPVVVLTSSTLIHDANRAYQLGANSFLVKELEFANFVEVTKVLQRYWLQTAKTPESYRPATKTDGRH